MKKKWLILVGILLVIVAAVIWEFHIKIMKNSWFLLTNSL